MKARALVIVALVLGGCAARSSPPKSVPAGGAPPPSPPAGAAPGGSGREQPKSFDGAPAADVAASAAMVELSLAENAIYAATGSCKLACRALGSMDRAAKNVCSSASDAERARCDEAKARVKAARARVRDACGTCEDGTSTDPDAP